MKRSYAIVLLVLLLGGVALVVFGLPRAQQPAVTPSQVEPVVAQLLALPPYSESPYLNTKLDAKHIGSAACAACHPNNHKSYLLTPHSRAMENINVNDEPPDATFEHKSSGRTYRVYRKDGQMWHQELLKTTDGKEIACTDYPMRYRVGSGHFTRTYLVEVDGFLHESPITWYESKKKWDTSPGFNEATHPGFERPALLNCMVCHVGNLENVADGDHRLKFHEQAIGCENCHGPGSLHKEFHLTKKLSPGTRDLTIVQPAKLSRPLLESICASCHLSTPTFVEVRGRHLKDFRPGLPLSDFRLHYNLGQGEGKMTVVGHVEQLRQSKCYQKSELTCITCHDPHAKSKPADPVAYYKQKCLDCHQTKGCTLPLPTRLKQNPADNCAACHMPQSDTDITHVAFTHHRIGRHAKDAPSKSLPETLPELVLLDDNPHLTLPDRQRNLGLAYLGLLQNTEYGRYKDAIWDRAKANIQAAHAGGVRDGDTLQALIQLHTRDNDLTESAKIAEEALRIPDPYALWRDQSLSVLAHHAYQNRDLPGALDYTQQLVRVRRFGGDWGLLGTIYLDMNQPDKALAAYKHANAIWPYLSRNHLGLAECYRRLRDPASAKAQAEKAEWLQQHIEK